MSDLPPPPTAGMESHSKILGHASHTVLIVFPAGLWLTSVVFDAVNLVKPDDELAKVAYWTLVGGLVGGLVAAVPGWIDWLAIPAGTRAKSVGLVHGLGNVLAIGLFGASWFFRLPDYGHPPLLPVLLSFAAAGLVTGTAWLGGELVERLGVGVDPGANLNAPNSLSGKPAA